MTVEDNHPIYKPQLFIPFVIHVYMVVFEKEVKGGKIEREDSGGWVSDPL